MNQVNSTESLQNFKGTYPKLLFPLFFSEMWERFCFYGMRGMLAVFMAENLGMGEVTANLQYGATQAFVYGFTFVGGLFADKILGLRRSLFWGGILMIIGSVILSLDPEEYFFLGISFTIIGTGFFKPNISTMVGSLYPENDPRQDAGFLLFYMGINIGALIGGYICIAVAQGELWQEMVPQAIRWNVAFGFAAVVMVISLVTFLFTQKKLANIGISPLLNQPLKKRKTYEFATYIGSLIMIPAVMVMVSVTEYTDYFMFTIGPLTLLYLIYEMRNLDSVQIKRLCAALIFIFFSIFFWAFFEQSGGSLSLFANSHLHDSILGIKMSANGVNNSANSAFVILFAIPIGIFWLWMNKRKLESNSIVKFGLAFLLLAIGFYVFYYTRFFSDENGITSLGIFTLGWLIISIGELCLSPIGMSLMTKLAPAHLQAIMMGMWFLASAYGQYFAGILGANIAAAGENASPLEKLNIYTEGYKQLGFYGLICGIVMIAIYPLVKKLMGGIK